MKRGNKIIEKINSAGIILEHLLCKNALIQSNNLCAYHSHILLTAAMLHSVTHHKPRAM